MHAGGFSDRPLVKALNIASNGARSVSLIDKFILIFTGFVYSKETYLLQFLCGIMFALAQSFSDVLCSSLKATTDVKLKITLELHTVRCAQRQV